MDIPNFGASVVCHECGAVLELMGHWWEAQKGERTTSTMYRHYTKRHSEYRALYKIEGVFEPWHKK